MERNKSTELNEIIEGLHYGQVIEFKYGDIEYALENYKLENDDHHSLCLYKFDKDDKVGTLIFADKIAEWDTAVLFRDIYCSDLTGEWVDFPEETFVKIFQE